MARERDYAYEALAEVSGTDPNTGRGALNSALKSIREESKIEDSYVLADEIHRRAKMYRQVMPDVMLTPNALAKHWLRVYEEAEQRKTKGTNVHAAPSECSVCGGDRYVVVNLRAVGDKDIAAVHFEEYAPCYACNSGVDAGFRRYDGTLVRTIDPAQVERMHKG